MHFRMVLHSGKRNEIKSFAELYNERATRLYSPWRVIYFTESIVSKDKFLITEFVNNIF